jgi:hypothetical protein
MVEVVETVTPGLPGNGRSVLPSPLRVVGGGGGLDGASHHGPLQEWWLTMGRAHDDGA